MGKKVFREDIRVIVYPDTPGWASEERAIQEAESVAAQIRRHVDDLMANGVQVVWDTAHVCEHCGYSWTEDSETYNGGCCAKDSENATAEEAAENVRNGR